MIKRMALSLICIFIKDHVSIQLIAFYIVTIFTMIYLQWVLPWDTKKLNFLDLLNEVTSIVTLYHMILFTDYVPEARIRYLFGWSLIFSNSVAISIHVFLMGKEILFELKKKIKRRFSRKH